MARALTLAGVVLAAVLVWYVGFREEPAERSRAEREAPAAPEPAPPPAAEGESPGAGPPPPAPGVVVVETKEMPVTIRGRVTAEGAPVAGALVYAAAEESSEQTESGEGGAFELHATGDVTLGAAHPDHGPVRKQIPAREGEVVEVELALPAERTVELLVLDGETGAPVVGASVLVMRAGKAGGLDGANDALGEHFMSMNEEEADFSLFAVLELTDLMTLFGDGGAPAVRSPLATTDGAGRARVGGLPPGTFDAVVRHAEFTPRRLTRQPIMPGEIVVKLSRGGGLTVYAPLVDGRVAEGYVCTVAKGGLMALPVGMRRIDAAGAAVFPHLAPGAYKVTVSERGDPSAFFGVAPAEVEEPEDGEPPPEVTEPPPPIATRPVTIVAGKMTFLDLTGEEGTHVEGRFLAGDRPVGEGMVMLLEGESYENQVGQSMLEESGRFAFRNLAPGRYRLVGMAESATAQRDFEIAEGQKKIEIVLTLGTAAIRGRVLRGDGAPVPGVQVFVTPADRPSEGPADSLGELMEQLAGQATAESDGTFAVAGLGAGRYRVVSGESGRLDAVEVALGEGEQASVELRFDDERQRRLLVRLEGADGKPVEGVVNLSSEAGGLVEAIVLMDGEEQDTLEPKPRAEHAFHLPPGRYRLRASVPGLADHRETITLDASREMTLRLRPGVSVTLAFTGPEGPAAGREVVVRDDSGQRLGSGRSLLQMLFAPGARTTDANGELLLEHVGPGEYTVHVDGEEVARVRVSDAAVKRSIRID